MRKGILVAADSHIEWLLPWWWKYYSKYNDFPVAFVDLGMTKKMRAWCRKRGEVIPLESRPDLLVSKKKGVATVKAKRWQKLYKGDVWQAREAWFKKPLACLQTPFDLTLWLDVDCEVCEPLKGLFEQWGPGIQLALVRERAKRVEYNSGVILFSKNAPFLEEWVRLCLEKNRKFMGDQNALTEAILKKNIPCKELDPVYNWLMTQGFYASIVIAHWCSWGKQHIKQFGGLHDLLEKIEGKEKRLYCNRLERGRNKA